MATLAFFARTVKTSPEELWSTVCFEHLLLQPVLFAQLLEPAHQAKRSD
jgi:hypothetical protein